MIHKAGKITWHITTDCPWPDDQRGQTIWIGRPNPPYIGATLMAPNRWRDGTCDRAPKLETSMKIDRLPWPRSLQASDVQLLEQHVDATKQAMPSTETESVSDTKRAFDSQIVDESGELPFAADRFDFSPGSAADDEYWEAHQ